MQIHVYYLVLCLTGTSFASCVPARAGGYQMGSRINARLLALPGLSSLPKHRCSALPSAVYWKVPLSASLMRHRVPLILRTSVRAIRDATRTATPVWRMKGAYYGACWSTLDAVANTNVAAARTRRGPGIGLQTSPARFCLAPSSPRILLATH
jgi:hypothetical protein